MSAYEPIITPTAIIFDLQKPIYGSFYGIWDKWLKIAKEKNLHMVVNCPQGKATYKYADWMRGAKRMERFYKNPDEPMIFYGRDMLPDIAKREERKEAQRKQKENEEAEVADLKKKAEILTGNDELRAKLGLRKK